MKSRYERQLRREALPVRRSTLAPVTPRRTILPSAIPSGHRLRAWWASSSVVAAVAAGGAVGACARFGMTAGAFGPGGWWHGWPVATFTANLAGSFFLGALLALLLDLTAPHRLARPFLGTGLLGGFTTFSAFAAETRELALDRPGIAVLYAASTVVLTVGAVRVGAAATRRFTRRGTSEEELAHADGRPSAAHSRRRRELRSGQRSRRWTR